MLRALSGWFGARDLLTNHVTYTSHGKLRCLFGSCLKKFQSHRKTAYSEKFIDEMVRYAIARSMAINKQRLEKIKAPDLLPKTAGFSPRKKTAGVHFGAPFLGVSKNTGKTPKMDGENNGKAY